jgi:hypothetical protein
MKKQLALIQDVPPPRAVMHECGAPAVEQFFFSPRHQKVASVVVCSQCHSSFYPKALTAICHSPFARKANPTAAAIAEKASVA